MERPDASKKRRSPISYSVALPIDKKTITNDKDSNIEPFIKGMTLSEYFGSNFKVVASPAMNKYPEFDKRHADMEVISEDEEVLYIMLVYELYFCLSKRNSS